MILYYIICYYYSFYYVTLYYTIVYPGLRQSEPASSSLVSRFIEQYYTLLNYIEYYNIGFH